MQKPSRHWLVVEDAERQILAGSDRDGQSRGQ